jgi:hypothetical protein
MSSSVVSFVQEFLSRIDGHRRISSLIDIPLSSCKGCSRLHSLELTMATHYCHPTLVICHNNRFSKVASILDSLHHSYCPLCVIRANNYISTISFPPSLLPSLASHDFSTATPSLDSQLKLRSFLLTSIHASQHSLIFGHFSFHHTSFTVTDSLFHLIMGLTTRPGKSTSNVPLRRRGREPAKSFDRFNELPKELRKMVSYL